MRLFSALLTIFLWGGLAFGQSPVSSTVPVGVAARHKIYSTATTIKTVAGIIADVGTDTITVEVFGRLTLGTGGQISPANLTWDFTNGEIDLAAASGALTIRGPVIVPNGKQIFFNTIADSVRFTNNVALTSIEVMWWGFSSDADALQKAINSLPTTPSLIVIDIPSGTFNTNAISITRSNVSIRGQGTAATVLNSTINDGTTPAITIQGSALLQNDHLANLRLTAPSANNTGRGIVAGRPDIGATDCYRMTFTNINIDTFDSDGFALFNCESVTIDELFINANAGKGLYFDGGAAGTSGFNRVTNTRASNNGGYNLHVKGNHNSTFDQFEALNTGDASGWNVFVQLSNNCTFIGLDAEQPSSGTGITFGDGHNTIIGALFDNLTTGILISIGSAIPITVISPRFGTVTAPISVGGGSMLNYFGPDLPLQTGAGSIINKVTLLGTMNFPKTTETIVGGATVTADACGGIKRITAAGAVTTSLVNTFTAPAFSNAGCEMDVCNVGTNNITLDNNSNFKSAGGADVVMTQDDCVRVGSTGASGVWYQLTPLVAN